MATIFYILAILLMGLSVVYPLPAGAEEVEIFSKHIFFISLFPIVVIIAAISNYSFLRSAGILIPLYIGGILTLIALLLFAPEINAAKSWFIIAGVSIQPVDFIKIILIAVLATYFAKRHVQIYSIKPILFSAVLIGIVFLLTVAQPDFGSAFVLILIWFGMILISGISFRHLLLLTLSGIAGFYFFWKFVFAEFQRERILSFLNPLEDLEGSGYNAFQSKIAVGSGEVFGKGIGEGTQSKLLFLPEYQSDFIFAAFAEEWGYIGVFLLFSLFILLIGRLIYMAYWGRTNFEALFIFGVAITFFSYFFIHVGVNIGLIPVTGIVLPLMSYGGSHLMAEYILLGMVMAMNQRSRSSRKGEMNRDISSSI